MTILHCLYFWDSPNLEGQVPVFISPRNTVAQLYPQALGYPMIQGFDTGSAVNVTELTLKFSY
jgi:hypothetical protein